MDALPNVRPGRLCWVRLGPIRFAASAIRSSLANFDTNSTKRRTGGVRGAVSPPESDYALTRTDNLRTLLKVPRRSVASFSDGRRPTETLSEAERSDPVARA